MSENLTKKVESWNKLSATTLYEMYGGLDGILDLSHDAIIIKFNKNGYASYLGDVIISDLISDIESRENCYLIGYYDDVRSLKINGCQPVVACDLDAAISRYIMYGDNYYIINMEWGDFFDIGTYALDELKEMCNRKDVFVVPKCLVDREDEPEE